MTRRAWAWCGGTALGLPALQWLLAQAWFRGWYATTDSTAGPPPGVVFAGIQCSWLFAALTALAIGGYASRNMGAAAARLRLHSRGVAGDAILGAGMAAAWVVFFGWKGSPPFEAMFAAPLAKLGALPLIVSRGLFEELLFRGLLLTALLQSGLAGSRAVAGTAAAFAAVYALGDADAVFWAAGFGLMAGAAALRRGSVWPAVWAHMLLEACIEPALILGKIGGGN